MIKFSMDGKYLVAVTSDPKIVIINTAGYNVLTTTATSGTNKHLYSVNNIIKIICLDFSPDGTLLATGDNRGNIKIWDVTNNFAFITTIVQTYNSFAYMVFIILNNN